MDLYKIYVRTTESKGMSIYVQRLVLNLLARLAVYTGRACVLYMLNTYTCTFIKFTYLSHLYVCILLLNIHVYQEKCVHISVRHVLACVIPDRK